MSKTYTNHTIYSVSLTYTTMAAKELLPIIIGCAIWGEAPPRGLALRQSGSGVMPEVKNKQAPNLNAPVTQLGVYRSPLWLLLIAGVY